VERADEADQDDRGDEHAVRLDLEQPLAEVARRGSPGRLRPGLALLQVGLAGPRPASRSISAEASEGRR
jgi:hypothetical protein